MSNSLFPRGLSETVCSCSVAVPQQSESLTRPSSDENYHSVAVTYLFASGNFSESAKLRSAAVTQWSIVEN